MTLSPLCLECHRSERLSSSLDNDNSSCSIIDEEQSTFPIQCLQASSFEPDAATEIQNFYYEKYNDLKQKKSFTIAMSDFQFQNANKIFENNFE